MASIHEVTTPEGRKGYRVHWQQTETGYGRQRNFLNIDEAAGFFYSCEETAAAWRTAGTAERCAAWSLQKLIWFFLGYRYDKLNRDEITLSSYQKSRYDLLAIQGDILKKPLINISPRELESSVRPAGLKWLRSAFRQLQIRELLPFNPAPKGKRKRRKPLDIPANATVKKMLSEAAMRERIACWLGAVCGLRICEVVALDGCDVDRDWIQINKHAVRGGLIVPGMKRGEQRQVKMPKGLYELIQQYDPDLIGSRRPLISSSRNGSHIGTGYSTQGELKRVLTRYGIPRFHCLRHFAVSRLAARGIDIIRVSRMIGHSDPSITMDIYGHLFGEVIDLDFD